ncbi:hypothetical protein [Streptomyces sp. BE303]|uniref:hypothetical protein n=1 Tax=Streptomycetaceae TaxID=2062 RepID=UPI002E7702DD|nr:hypothetical protein [Streptomyces sp. BE303]MED7954697.1 hypothetical protein [Streptomyces sp. BE303]
MSGVRTGRRRRVWIWVLVVLPLALLGAVGYVAFRADAELRHPEPNSGRPGSWMTTLTATEISEFTQVPIPAGAVDARWGYTKGFQDDTAVLAFRLPADEVDRFTAGLREATWKEAARPPDTGALRDLQRIGAPDPLSALTLRYGTFVSHLPGHTKRVASQVWLGPSAGDSPVQVWVYAMNVP